MSHKNMLPFLLKIVPREDNSSRKCIFQDYSGAPEKDMSAMDSLRRGIDKTGNNPYRLFLRSVYAVAM